MLKLFKRLLLFIIAVLAVVILIAGYLGFMPGVSSLFGSDKPKDLGVTYTAEDYDSYVAKAKVKFEDLASGLPPRESLKFSGQQDTNASFLDKEVTAMVGSDKWKYYPVSNTQIKISSDGMVEVSGTLRLDRLPNYALAEGIISSDYEAAMDYLKYIKTNPAFYVKGTGYVTDNKVSLNLSQASIGRLNLPQSELIKQRASIERFVEGRIKFVPNFNIKSLTFQDGKMNFDGSFPAVQSSSNR